MGIVALNAPVLPGITPKQDFRASIHWVIFYPCRRLRRSCQHTDLESAMRWTASETPFKLGNPDWRRVLRII